MDYLIVGFHDEGRIEVRYLDGYWMIVMVPRQENGDYIVGDELDAYLRNAHPDVPVHGQPSNADAIRALVRREA